MNMRRRRIESSLNQIIQFFGIKMMQSFKNTKYIIFSISDAKLTPPQILDLGLEKHKKWPKNEWKNAFNELNFKWFDLNLGLFLLLWALLVQQLNFKTGRV